MRNLAIRVCDGLVQILQRSVFWHGGRVLAKFASSSARKNLWRILDRWVRSNLLQRDFGKELVRFVSVGTSTKLCQW